MGGGSANETAGEGSRGRRRGFGRDAAVILRRLLLCLGGYTAAAAAAPLWGIISTTHAKGNRSKEGQKGKVKESSGGRVRGYFQDYSLRFEGGVWLQSAPLRESVLGLNDCVWASQLQADCPATPALTGPVD